VLFDNYSEIRQSARERAAEALAYYQKTLTA